MGCNYPIEGTMNILILYYDPSVGHLLQMVLEAEEYTVTATRNATEAIHAIEDSSDSYLLFADNFYLNPEAQQAFTMLHNRPDLRRRVTIVGVSAMSEGARQRLANNMIDDHLALPFNVDQLLRVVEAHTSDPPH